MFTQHATRKLLIALFFALSLFSCEKEYLLEGAEVRNSEIEQRSDTSALIQQIAEDSSFIRLFQLSTVDNYVLWAYMDNQLDTTDIWLLFDELGIDYSSPVLTVQHDSIGFEEYDDFLDFVENEYGDPLMVQYFEELAQSWHAFRQDKQAALDGLDYQHLEYVLSQAYLILLKDHEQIFADRIAPRTDPECQECYREYEICRSDNGYSAAANFFGLLVGGAATGGMFGTAAGPAGTAAGAAGGAIMALSGAAITTSFNWAIGNNKCNRDLNNCLLTNGCEALGGGGTSGGNGCLECVIQT